MERILEQVERILQNVNQVELSINAENQGVRHLAKELGMMNEIDCVVSDLKRVYKG